MSSRLRKFAFLLLAHAADHSRLAGYRAAAADLDAAVHRPARLLGAARLGAPHRIERLRRHLHLRLARVGAVLGRRSPHRRAVRDGQQRGDRLLPLRRRDRRRRDARRPHRLDAVRADRRRRDLRRRPAGPPRQPGTPHRLRARSGEPGVHRPRAQAARRRARALRHVPFGPARLAAVARDLDSARLPRGGGRARGGARGRARGGSGPPLAARLRRRRHPGPLDQCPDTLAGGEVDTSGLPDPRRSDDRRRRRELRARFGAAHAERRGNRSAASRPRCISSPTCASRSPATPTASEARRYNDRLSQARAEFGAALPQPAAGSRPSA